MIDTKELRDRAATFGSDYLTDEEWVEVIDRLDVAEKELESWKGLAQQLGNEVGALRFRLERRQDELNRLRANLESAEKERDALRAKVEVMERQEPVAWLHETRRDSDVVTDTVKHVWGKAVVGSLAAYSIPLYLAPGAKGE